jgi:tRNA (mo5U34)-methyltransferase
MMTKINTKYISINHEIGEKELEVLRYKDWRQRIELSPGFFTPGHIISDIWDTAKVPNDLKGKSFLDIGANDGMFSFLAEKKGASEIFATDLYKDGIDTMKNGWSFDGIKLLKKHLDSKVEIHSLSVFDIEKLNRKFDVVFCNNVIAWLYDIPKAIKLMSDVCNDTLIITDGFLNTMSKDPILRYEVNAPFLYRPNVTFMNEVFKENGFKKITMNKIDSYSLFLKQSKMFPLVKLPMGTKKFYSPMDIDSYGSLEKERLTQATGCYNNKFYVKSIGWVNANEVSLVPYTNNFLVKSVRTLLQDNLYESLKSKIMELKDEITVLSVVGQKK